MPDDTTTETTTATEPDLSAKYDALEQKFSALEAKYQSALDDEEADDPGKDAKALQKRISDITGKRREMIGDLRTLREELGGFKAQLGEVKGSYQQQIEAAIKAKDAEFSAQIQAIAGEHVDDMALADNGIKDDLGRAAVRQAHKALPEDKRGDGTAADWYRGLLEAQQAHKADPESVAAPAIPRTLLGYMPQDVAPATRTHPGTERNRAPRVAGAVTASDINNAKTMEEYKAALEKMRAQQRKG